MITAFYFCSLASISSGSAVEEQSTRDHKFEGLNGAAAGIERIRLTEKLDSLMLRHIYIKN
jgi:hypothetical protein